MSCRTASLLTSEVGRISWPLRSMTFPYRFQRIARWIDVFPCPLSPRMRWTPAPSPEKTISFWPLKGPKLRILMRSICIVAPFVLLTKNDLDLFLTLLPVIVQGILDNQRQELIEELFVHGFCAFPVDSVQDVK